jgi:hypothetical protein
MDDIDILIDSYQTLKEYIPTKDRQAAADHLVGSISDYNLSDADIKAFAGVDQYLKRAFETYIGEDLDTDSEDDDYGYDDYDDEDY